MICHSLWELSLIDIAGHTQLNYNISSVIWVLRKLNWCFTRMLCRVSLCTYAFEIFSCSKLTRTFNTICIANICFLLRFAQWYCVGIKIIILTPDLLNGQMLIHVARIWSTLWFFWFQKVASLSRLYIHILHMVQHCVCCPVILKMCMSKTLLPGLDGNRKQIALLAFVQNQAKVYTCDINLASSGQLQCLLQFDAVSFVSP